MTKDPVLFAYTLTVVVNTFNLLVLWNLSGFARARSRTTLNPEDARTVVRGAEVVTSEPEAVARVLRAHRNSADNIIPFLLLGLVFALERPDPLEAQIIFGAFTFARLLFSFAYLAGLQPWRTLGYTFGALTTLALMVEVVRHALA
jgi:microsomal prostaglandin-E synthase 1